MQIRELAPLSAIKFGGYKEEALGFKGPVIKYVKLAYVLEGV